MRTLTRSALALVIIAAVTGCDDPAEPLGAAGPAAATSGSSRAASAGGAGGESVFRFESMVGNTATRSNGAIRGIDAGGAPWVLDRADGRLDRSGELRVEVEGLIIPGRGNPVPSFRAVLSCYTEVVEGGVTRVELAPPVATGLFPATPEGDSEIRETLTGIPQPCLAPLVFVTSPGGAWFAVTGF